MNNIKLNRNKIIAMSLIFLSLVIFYLKVNPMYIFDTDDWLNIIPSRTILPQWKGWNPGKATPEVILPVMTILSKFLVYPFTKNIIDATAIVYGIFVAILVSVLFYQLLKIYDIDNKDSCLYVILLFVFLLELFDRGDSKITSVFASVNVTCVFNFLVPNVMNMILVCKLIQIDEGIVDIDNTQYTKIGVYLLYIYLCMFSNLYSNVLPVIYASMTLIQYVINKKKNKKLFLINGIIILLWVVCAFYEYNGGRATQIGDDSWLVHILDCVITIWNVFKSIKPIVRNMMLTTIVIAVVLKSDRKKLLKLGICQVLTVFYYVLLEAKAGSHMSEGSTRLSLVFYVVMMFVISLKIIYQNSPLNKLLMVVCPFLICLLLSNFFLTIFNIRSMNFNNLDPQIAYNISNDMIEQYEIAAENGENMVEIHIPDFYSDDNWPIAIYGADRFSKAMFYYGDGGNYIEVSFAVDREKNKQFKICN